MKVIVIGCTHAGTAAIMNISKTHLDAEITVYERNDNISFLSCGIALSVSKVVQKMESLFYNSPENLAKLGVITKMKHDVINVDFDNKKVEVKNLETGETGFADYDKLVITCGSWPIIPKIEGGDLKNIVLCKNYNHAKDIVEKAKNAEKVLIVGAGYIGTELFEAFLELDKKVTIIDGLDRVLYKYLDEDFTLQVENEFKNHGGILALSQTVNKFVGENGKVSKAITDKGEYETDLVVLCIGFRPATELFKGKLDMHKSGAIIVNEYMQTSIKDVYAAGDCATVKYNPTNTTQYIPLATNAVRMGVLVAANLKENNLAYVGTQGTSGIKIYDLNIASTGLTECMAIEAGVNYATVINTESYRPQFMPTYEDATIKLVYEKETKIILGGQIMSKMDLTAAINTISLAIAKKVTIQELALTDFFFQPHFNNPVNFLNSVAMKAL